MSSPSSDSVERERRWLVRRLPDQLPPPSPIAQGYVAHQGSVAVRVRRRGDRHVATIKGGSGGRRTEVEWDITPEQFDVLWPLTEGRRVEKLRHEVAVDGYTAEVDVFGGALDGLVLVEVEFDGDEAMAGFDPPGWFGPEVTDDHRYTNVSLADHGVPDDHPPGFPQR